MKTLLRVIFILLIFEISYAFEIHSISPEEIRPNSSVQIKGKFDIENLTIFLGKQELSYQLLNKENISLTIPSNIEPSIYMLNFFDKKNDRLIIGLPIKISKASLKISNFEPKFLDFCDYNKDIEINGENLGIIKYVYVNGVEIENVERSNNFIKIKLPDGFFIPLNQNYITLTFYNENRNLLELINISINTRPEIESAQIVSNFLNYYEVVIKGKNFIKDSKLFINGIEINQRYSKLFEGIYIFGQQYITKPMSTTMLHDSFFIENCNTLILTRYPVTSDLKTLKIQIESPTGQKSSEYILNAP
ncbi:MAG: hypothetical protein N2202_06685 [Proteobacteria bacterium]|nr:hypothetical protein [Pseudomonadota bacterium]